MGPTIAGFITFIREVMGIGAGTLPTNSYTIQFAFNVAMMIANPQLAFVPNPNPAARSFPNYYALAVYNLAGDRLINYAQDNPNAVPQYFADLRKSFRINSFVPGVVSSTSDEGTSTSLEVLESLKNLTLAQLQYLKTPYGQAYLGLAAAAGPTDWGIS